MKLSELNPGEYGIIKEVLGRGTVHRRLLSMGLLPGAIIRVVRTSPLGDPVEYELRGFFISLRKQEASYIIVDRVVPLSMIPSGTDVQVIFIDGGVGFIRNMGTMGIAVGKKVHVTKRCCPMIIRTELGDFTLGRGMAYRIFVR
ncbi:MAG: iron transporter FeoA [Euryarchaeota archaeon]|nr:iron transporter FeoA [Euryarchaeota archaeon]